MVVADVGSASPDVFAAPDWSREKKSRPFEWSPSKSLIAAIRSHQRHLERSTPWSALLARIAVLRWRFWSVVAGSSIPLRCRIGGGLQMPHTNGIVINAAAIVGFNCDIYQQVTLGEMKGGCPTIGNGVFIGPGAKILGAVTIGDGARIGANALVIDDVPAYARVYATPARIDGEPSASCRDRGE